MPKKFLLKHVGNMGDMVFFIPPVLETLKKKYPDCHITFVTAWGFKDKKGHWGKRNQDGFCIALMMTNPHIDQLIHWHDTKLSLDKKVCAEEGRSFPTWNKKYFEEQKNSGHYDHVYELDFGVGHADNPIQKVYALVGLSGEAYSNYKVYFTEHDKEVAAAAMRYVPRPRVILLEGLEGTTTRGWDPSKVLTLEKAIQKTYDVTPLWFGGHHVPFYRGRPLTLRENIARLLYCDVGIGVLSGPLHFAAAAGLPTITLYADHPLHRAAPAYFLNRYIPRPDHQHRTLLGPSTQPYRLLKREPTELTPDEKNNQGFRDWTQPGRQATKSGVAVISVDEITALLRDMLPV